MPRSITIDSTTREGFCTLNLGVLNASEVNVKRLCGGSKKRTRKT